MNTPNRHWKIDVLRYDGTVVSLDGDDAEVTQEVGTLSVVRGDRSRTFAEGVWEEFRIRPAADSAAWTTR